MSVLLVVNSEDELDNLPAWDLVFAKALNLNLKIAIVKRSAKSSDSQFVGESTQLDDYK